MKLTSDYYVTSYSVSDILAECKQYARVKVRRSIKRHTKKKNIKWRKRNGGLA